MESIENTLAYKRNALIQIEFQSRATNITNHAWPRTKVQLNATHFGIRGKEGKQLPRSKQATQSTRGSLDVSNRVSRIFSSSQFLSFRLDAFSRQNFSDLEHCIITGFFFSFQDFFFRCSQVFLVNYCFFPYVVSINITYKVYSII